MGYSPCGRKELDMTEATKHSHYVLDQPLNTYKYLCRAQSMAKCYKRKIIINYGLCSQGNNHQLTHIGELGEMGYTQVTEWNKCWRGQIEDQL